VSIPGSSATASFKYDVDGRRVQQVANSTTINYLWDEASHYGDVVLETNASGAVQTSYGLGIACGSCGNSPIGELLSQHKGGTLSYYLLDGQGSVRGLTSTSGTLTDSYNYDAFGQLTSGQTNPASSYLYTGQQYDTLTQLYDLRARYYNPAQGRFLSQDTWPIDLQNPIELNRYAHARNNPISYNDPSGLSGAVLTYGYNSFNFSIRINPLILEIGLAVVAAIGIIIAFASNWRDTSITKDQVKVRPLTDKEVERRGLHREKAAQGYGATDTIYEEQTPKKGRTWIGNEDEEGELQPFP
jgi:RHS repeat-associated protein